MCISELSTRIYLADIRDFASGRTPDRLLAAISPKRRQKMEALKRESDRKRSLVAGFLLEEGLRMLAESHGMERRDFHMAVNGSGKPYILGASGLHFNLSHSGHLVICAFSSREIGCDVQEHKGYSEDMAERFLTEEEYRYVVSPGSLDIQKERFFQIWTMKESYVKALGESLGDHLSRESMASGKGRLRDEIKVGNLTYRFKSFFVREGYSMSCCTSKMEEVQLVRIRNKNDLRKDIRQT